MVKKPPSDFPKTYIFPDFGYNANVSVLVYNVQYKHSETFWDKFSFKTMAKELEINLKDFIFHKKLKNQVIWLLLFKKD